MPVVEIRMKSAELLSLRIAARHLYDAVTRLERGEVEKFVLLDQRNAIRAVVLAPETYARLADAVDSSGSAPRAA
jgi:hypothetical protein